MKRENEMANNPGVKVVLTASATEMSDFANNPFVAFVGGFAKGPFPLWLLRRVLYPPVERRLDDGRAKYAPYGLRKVEALLLESGFGESEVAVIHPRDLDAFIGPDTKVVGISSMDPTGMGYVSKTYSSIFGGGEPMNAVEFRELVMNRSIRTYKPKVIVGGFGAWQLERKKVADSYGVDCVMIGEGEETVTEIFSKAVKGESLPRVVRVEKNADSEKVPVIRHAAIHGCVEISRGCGRNCQFCTPTMQKKRDVGLGRILQEVKTTVDEGCSQITLVTEDLFLYGSKKERFVPDKEAVLKLIRSVASVPGVESIQPSHTSLAPVAADPSMVKEVAEVLLERNWYYHGSKPIVTSETGLETGSVRLMRKYMAGKMLPFRPEEWKQVVSESFGIMNDNDWYPLATLIIGLPDEEEEDVFETLELMDDLRDYQAFYVPLLFVPLENCMLMDKRGAELNSLSKARWQLLTRCWEYNVRIWRDTFLKHRIPNPLLFNFAKKIVIPYAGKVAGFYYKMKHGDEMERAIWRMVSA
jgi:radical SAM superfamily enzyme YgiQ (UPF0313 family)